MNIELISKLYNENIFNKEKGIITFYDGKVIGKIGNDLIYGVNKNIMYPLLYCKEAISFYKENLLYVFPSLGSSYKGDIYLNDIKVGEFKLKFLINEYNDDFDLKR